MNIIDLLDADQGLKQYFIEIIIQNKTERESLIFLDGKCNDPFFNSSAELAVSTQQCSISMIQQHFSLGYNRSGRIIDQLIRFGIIRKTSDNAHEILVKSIDFLEKILTVINNISEDEKRMFLENNSKNIAEKIKSYEDLAEEERAGRKMYADEIQLERIKQKIIEHKRKKELKKLAYEELSKDNIINEVKKREPIPQEVQDIVWNRDSGKCVKCGSNENLEFDHIIPFSKGGSNSVRNLQLLCQKCNREKSNNIG